MEFPQSLSSSDHGGLFLVAVIADQLHFIVLSCSCQPVALIGHQLVLPAVVLLDARGRAPVANGEAHEHC
eukprot:3622191-Lingulodinium_polyedra.AAC.1